MLGPIARAAKEFMPAPKSPGVMVETSLEGYEIFGVPVRGRIDLLLHPPEHNLEICDWKTTGDWRRTTPGRDLDRLTQMSIYGSWAMDTFQEASVVLTHVNMMTRGTPDARRESKHFAWYELKPTLQAAHASVSWMKVAAKAEKPEDVPVNLRACDAYRGCAYRAQCPRKPIDVARAAMGLYEECDMDLLAKLRTTSNQPETTKVEEPKTTMLVGQEAQEAAKANGSEIPAGAGYLAAVNPPDAAPPDATPPEKKGRGKKQQPKKPEGLESMVALREYSNLEIYADVVGQCVQGAHLLDAYIRSKCEELAAAEGAADIRCAPDGSALAFGKWKGALAALVKENPPAPALYVTYGVRESEVKQVVLEALGDAVKGRGA